MEDVVVTGLRLFNLPIVAELLYKDVLGDHVRIAHDLVLPLSRGIPVGKPIAEIVLKPDEKTHRIAYRALLRDAVARRIRELGGEVEGKNIRFCRAKLIYDVTLSNDTRFVTVFPQGDVNPIKALDTLKRFSEKLGYIELKGNRIHFKGPVRLSELRGGFFPEPGIVMLDRNDEPAKFPDPVRAIMYGEGRAIEGGVDVGKRISIRVYSDNEQLLEKLYDFIEAFIYGRGLREGYIDIMRTEVDRIEKELIKSPEELLLKLDEREVAFIVYSSESPSLYRLTRKSAIAKKAIVHLIRKSSLEEFINAFNKRRKLCGLAALAVDIHKKIGLLPYKLDEKDVRKLFERNIPAVYGVSVYRAKYIAVKYTPYGRFLRSRILDSLGELFDILEEGSIIYSQGVRELSRRKGAILYIDRRTPLGIIKNNEPARGAYIFTPREAFVVTGFNCRALRIRFIRPRNYRTYALALYTYRSSRLLQRDFPILVPPAIRSIDRIREHISNGAVPSKGKTRDRPRFL